MIHPRPYSLSLTGAVGIKVVTLRISDSSSGFIGITIQGLEG